MLMMIELNYEGKNEEDYGKFKEEMEKAFVNYIVTPRSLRYLTYSTVPGSSLKTMLRRCLTLRYKF